MNLLIFHSIGVGETELWKGKLVSCLIFVCGSVSTLILLSTSGFLLFNCCVVLISNLTLLCLGELKQVVQLILQHVTECV